VRHLSGDDLALHYYGESQRSAAIERHLRSCPRCASEFARITRTLGSITAPDTSDPGDEFPLEIWQHVRSRALQNDPRPRLAPFVWLVPLLYPLSFLAIFESARLAHEQATIGIPLVVLALGWALAGPFVAVFALSEIRGGRTDAARHQFVVFGALLATISPALFNLTSRTGLGLPAWYGATALAAVASFLPIPEFTGAIERLRRFHRLSALLIVIFAVAHVANQAFAIVSVSSHTFVQNVLRVVYRQPLIETLLIAAIALQVATGTMMWRGKVQRGSTSANLQAASGLYLAVFFLAHVSAVALARQYQTETNFVWAAGPMGLLARPGLTALLPYYLLAIVALFVHVGYYARVTAMAFLPELPVRRLSYAAITVCGTLVLTIGLALCGIHLAP